MSDPSILQEDEDVILESPNVHIPHQITKSNRRNNSSSRTRRNIFDREAFIQSLNLDEPVYNVNTIKNYPPCHLLKAFEIVPNDNYLKNISNKNLESKFSKVHIYRTISEIVSLENCVFQLDNVRIIGIYKYGKIPTSGQNNCHYIEERRTTRKIEIDLNMVEYFPLEKSISVFFGAIKLKTVNNGTVPYIYVKFFQELSDPEKYETLFHLQKQFRPREFDSVVSFDVTYDQSVLEFNEMVFETNDNTMCGDFDATLFINNIESDELLYYEIERLMAININD